MSKYHVVYVTDLGVSFIEKAQEFESELDAIADAMSHAASEYAKGRSVILETHEGRYVALSGHSHIQTLTPDELAFAQKQAPPND